MTPNVEDVFDNAEGRELAQAGTRQPVICDFCESVVHPNSRITHYAMNYQIDHDTAVQEGVWLDRLYCADCDRQRIRMPCKSAAEVLFSHQMTRERTLVDWDIRDYSAFGEGLSWSPKDVLGAFWPGRSWQAMAEVIAHTSPESVIDHFVWHDIDPRDVIDDEGEIQHDALPAIRQQLADELSAKGGRA